MNLNFREALDKLNPEYDSDYFLDLNGRKTQRDLIRIKNKQRWLILEMQQPTLTIFKNFDQCIFPDEDDDNIECSPKAFSEDQKLQFRLKTSIIEDFASCNLQGWEMKALKFLRIDLSSLNLL